MKLHDLKEWLTVADAARYLSILFGEDVSQADVLRLGLDGHLRLSVFFVNGAYGRCGPVVSIDDAKRTIREENPDDWSHLRSGPATEASKANPADWSHLTGGPSTGEGEAEGGAESKVRAFWHSLDGLPLGDGRVLEYVETAWLGGVWDLTMLGRERVEIEQRYWLLTEGPDVDRRFWDSALDYPIVSREDGTYCQLHEQPDGSDRWYPADNLPADSVIVVRTSALHDLEARLSGPAKIAEKPMGQRERTSLLVMIAALAKLADIDVTKPSSAAATIESQTALMGARVAARTIENHLKLIPKVMEDRSD